MNGTRPRIFLDVTSACQSPLNTGVKRMQRGLWGWLARAGDGAGVPVYWQSARRTYRKLTERDKVLLDPESVAGVSGVKREAGTGEVRGLNLVDVPLAGALADWRYFRRDAALELPRLRAWNPGEVLMVPDLFWDNRGKFFRERAPEGVRTVGVFHDAIGLRRGWRAGVDGFFCARGVRALARMDLVLCISKEAEGDLLYYWKKFGLAPTATRVVPWPVPFTGKRPVEPASFAARSVLYVARLEEHKNHLRLLQACERLWQEGVDFRLRLIGCHAYPGHSWKVRREISRLRRQGRAVVWQGHVPEAELHSAYQDSSFTVFPSLLEGFGLPILESLWHGRPVVCGSCGALGEVAAGGGCESVDPADTASLARGIRCLLEDPERHRQRCREIECRPFQNWDGYWREVMDALEALKPKQAGRNA